MGPSGGDDSSIVTLVSVKIRLANIKRFWTLWYLRPLWRNGVFGAQALELRVCPHSGLPCVLVPKMQSKSWHMLQPLLGYLPVYPKGPGHPPVSRVLRFPF